MKCPYCQQEMRSGSITMTRDRLRFVDDGKKLTFGEMLSSTGVLLSAGPQQNRYASQYCPRCRKVILDALVNP